MVKGANLHSIHVYGTLLPKISLYILVVPLVACLQRIGSVCASLEGWVYDEVHLCKHLFSSMQVLFGITKQ